MSKAKSLEEQQDWIETLHQFVIGAMELEAMVRYIDAGSLLIVGNRQDAHRCAIEQGAGVLITGGFGTNEDVKHLSDQLGAPDYIMQA